jgi:hypothetical protein
MLRVLVLGGGDRDLRAASLNLGLVWQQARGMDMPSYQQLTCGSVDLGPDLRAELTDTNAIDFHYERHDGLAIRQFTASSWHHQDRSE